MALLAGECGFSDCPPPPIVSSLPTVVDGNMDENAQSFPEVFAACAVTCAMTRVEPDPEQGEGVYEVQPVTYP